MELTGPLLRPWLAVRGRHRPTLKDMELADGSLPTFLPSGAPAADAACPARAAA